MHLHSSFKTSLNSIFPNCIFGTSLLFQPPKKNMKYNQLFSVLLNLIFTLSFNGRFSNPSLKDTPLVSEESQPKERGGAIVVTLDSPYKFSLRLHSLLRLYNLSAALDGNTFNSNLNLRWFLNWNQSKVCFVQFPKWHVCLLWAGASP